MSAGPRTWRSSRLKAREPPLRPAAPGAGRSRRHDDGAAADPGRSDPWLEATLSRNLVTAAPRDAVRLAHRRRTMPRGFASPNARPSRRFRTGHGGPLPAHRRRRQSEDGEAATLASNGTGDRVFRRARRRRGARRGQSSPRDPRARLVRSLYGASRYDVGATFWSSLTAHFVNNNSILTYLPVLAVLRPLTINGMFYVMRTGAIPATASSLCCRKQRRLRSPDRPGPRRRRAARTQRRSRCGRRWAPGSATPGSCIAGTSSPTCSCSTNPLRVQMLLFVLLGLPSMLLWASMLTLALDLWGFAALVLGWAGRYVLLQFVYYGPSAMLPKGSWPMSSSRNSCSPSTCCTAGSRKIRWRKRTILVERDGNFTYLSRLTFGPRRSLIRVSADVACVDAAEGRVRERTQRSGDVCAHRRAAGVPPCIADRTRVDRRLELPVRRLR